MPHHWPFYFQVLSMLYPVVSPGLVLCARCILHCQELQDVALMLHKMAFRLSGKMVVALHLDNNTAKAYLSYQGGTASLFLPRLACCILNLADKHGITLIPTYTFSHLSVEANYLSQGRLVKSGTCFLVQLRMPFIFGVSQMWTCLHPHGPINVSYATPWEIQKLWESWDWMFSTTIDLSSGLCVFSSCIGPLVLSRFLAGHVTGQFRLLVLLAPCWMEAPWLPTLLGKLVDITHQCPILKDLILDALIGQVLMGLKSLHFTLWLLRDVCCTDKGSLPWCVRQWWRWLEYLQKNFTNSAGKSWLVGVLERVYQTLPSLLLKLLICLFTYQGLVWPGAW